MARAFTAAKIGEMVWPELAAVGALCIGHVVIRGIDAAFALDRPFRRVSDWGHVAVLGTTAYCVATDRAPDVSKAMFYANMGLLGTSFGDWLYKTAVGTKVAQIRARKIAEKQIAAGTKTGAGNPLQQTPAQNPALLQAARQRAQSAGTQQRGYVVNDTKRGTIG